MARLAPLSICRVTSVYSAGVTQHRGGCCAGSNHPTNRALSSRGSTATGSTPTGAGARLASGRALQPYCDAEAWMQQGEYLALRGSYGPAKVHAFPSSQRVLQCQYRLHFLTGDRVYSTTLCCMWDTRHALCMTKQS